MAAIAHREVQVYESVRSGEREIDERGRIWRLAVRHWDAHINNTRLINVAKRRGEGDIGRYLNVQRTEGRHHWQALAHRLVYLHFFGPIPSGLTINHKDGDGHNNKPSNLELATHSDQAIHAVRVLRTHPAARQFGMANPRAKLTDREVHEIKARRVSGEKLSDIASDYGIAFQTVSAIALGLKRTNGSSSR